MNEENQIKNERARVVTIYIFIKDARGQLISYSVVWCGQNSKPFKLLCMSLLPTRKKIHSNMKAVELSQHFLHCRSMGIFQMFKFI